MAKPIRVLHLISSSNIGGSPRHTLLLCEELLKAGHYPVLAYPGGGSFEESFQNSGIKCYPLTKMSLLSPSGYQHLYSIIEKEKIDIIHTHELKSDFIGYWIARYAHIPVVTTVHNMITHSRLNPLKRKIYCEISKYLYNSMDKVLAVSGAVRNNLVEELGVHEPKVAVILNGTRKIGSLSQTPGKEIIFKRLNINPHSKVLISIGRLIPIQKGFEYLIKAMPAIVAQDPGIILLITGDGIIRNELESMAEKLGVSRNIVFTGWRNDTQELLSAADICLAPSLWDPLPRTVLESMMVGTPVIASRVDGIVEAITHEKDGLLIQPASENDIADAVIKLLKQPALIRQYGDSAREKALQLFTSERHAAQTIQVYTECLKET
jgi:glycosyltransferase involved in cell wall biosynthesis